MEAKNHLNQEPTRRTFITTSAVAGAGVLLAPSVSIFSQHKHSTPMSKNIQSKGYAGTNEKTPLTSWEFERRPVGDNDVLIEIKYSGICHSDIHANQGLNFSST